MSEHNIACFCFILGVAFLVAVCWTYMSFQSTLDDLQERVDRLEKRQ